MRLRGCRLLQPPVHPARGAHAGELPAALRPPARRAGQPAIGLRLALAGAAEAAPARSAPVSRRAAFEPATLPPCGKDTVRRPPMSAYRKSPEAIARLTPEQYRVTQESATESPGTGEHLHTNEPGIYVDIVSRSEEHTS